MCDSRDNVFYNLVEANEQIKRVTINLTDCSDKNPSIIYYVPLRLNRKSCPFYTCIPIDEPMESFIHGS